MKTSLERLKETYSDEEIEILVKQAELKKKILIYSREISIKGDAQLVKDGFSDDGAEVKAIVDFKELDQGCELWVSGEKYPMRAFFQQDRTDAVHIFKRFIPTIIRTLKGSIFKKITALVYLNANKDELIDFIHSGMRNAIIAKQYYAQPVAEIYRVIKNEKIRDIVCAILQFDPAYRYRFQDIICEIDKEAFETQPIEEIKRVLGILKRRDVTGLFVGKGFKEEYIYWLLRLKPSLIKELQNIIRDINLDEVRLSKEDWYWCCSGYTDYNFKDINHEERNKQYLKLKNS